MYSATIVDHFYIGHKNRCFTFVGTHSIRSRIAIFPIIRQIILFSVSNRFLNILMIPILILKVAFSLIIQSLSRLTIRNIRIPIFYNRNFSIWIAEIKNRTDGINQGLPLAEVYFNGFFRTGIIDNHAGIFSYI